MPLHFSWPQITDQLIPSVVGLSIDGTDSAALIDGTTGRIRIDKAASWESLSIDVTLTLPEQLPDGVDPSTIRVHALVTCAATSQRIPSPMHTTDGRTFSTQLTVTRDELAATAHLGAIVVVTEVGQPPKVIADSESWAIITDPAAAPSAAGGRPIKTAWIDFGDSAAPPNCRAYPLAPAYLDLNAPEPILLFNKSIDGLQQLLMNDKAKLEKKRLRDVISTSIASYAIAALVRAAAEAVGDDPEEAQAPTKRALSETCEALARVMQSVVDVAELYKRMALAQQAGGTIYHDFWSEVDLAVAVLADQAEVVAKATKDVLYV